MPFKTQYHFNPGFWVVTPGHLYYTPSGLRVKFIFTGLHPVLCVLHPFGALNKIFLPLHKSHSAGVCRCNLVSKRLLQGRYTINSGDYADHKSTWMALPLIYVQTDCSVAYCLHHSPLILLFLYPVGQYCR